MAKQGSEFRDSRTKRRFDVAGALFLGGLTSPLAATVALEIMAENRTLHPLYVKERAGKNGELAKMHKFRTFWRAVNVTEPISGSKDPRATAITQVWRDTRLDELPGLWDILVGNDSFCGPRRIAPEHEEEYEEIVGKPKMDRYKGAMEIGTGVMIREQIESVLHPVHTPEIIERRIDGGIRYAQEATLLGDFAIMGYAANVLGRRMLGLLRAEPSR